jgi:hypothetical protein
VTTAHHLMGLALQSVNINPSGDRIANEHVKVSTHNIFFFSLNVHGLYLMCNFGFQGLITSNPSDKTATVKKRDFRFNTGETFFVRFNFLLQHSLNSQLHGSCYTAQVYLYYLMVIRKFGLSQYCCQDVRCSCSIISG